MLMHMAGRMFVSHSFVVVAVVFVFRRMLKEVYTSRMKKKSLSNQSVEKEGVECLFYERKKAGKGIAGRRLVRRLLCAQFV